MSQDSDEADKVTDYIDYDTLRAQVDADLFAFLCRETPLVGLDGRPCWEATTFPDLLARYKPPPDR